MDEKIEKYIVDIIFATREPSEYNLQKLQNADRLRRFAPRVDLAGQGRHELMPSSGAAAT